MILCDLISEIAEKIGYNPFHIQSKNPLLQMTKQHNLMSIDDIQKLIHRDMQKTNETILAQLNSDVTLINQLGYYIIQSGGKRIRPMIAILAARALGFHGEQPITCATFIEFIHTATLLHDDVVDESALRRGNPTANAEFGNAASVLVGDFIYTRAFQLMTQLDSLRILKVMSDATNVIAEGEVQQLMNVNDPNTTERKLYASHLWQDCASIRSCDALRRDTCSCDGSPRKCFTRIWLLSRHSFSISR